MTTRNRRKQNLRRRNSERRFVAWKVREVTRCLDLVVIAAIRVKIVAAILARAARAWLVDMSLRPWQGGDIFAGTSEPVGEGLTFVNRAPFLCDPRLRLLPMVQA